MSLAGYLLLVFLALLVDAVHEVFEFWFLIWCKDRPDAVSALLADLLVLRFNRGVERAPLSARIVYDGT